MLEDVPHDHARHVNDAAPLSPIRMVLQGSDDKRRKGIAQGNEYSSTALNVWTHHALDLGAKQGHHPPWFW